jgi:hypothetical protein
MVLNINSILYFYNSKSNFRLFSLENLLIIQFLLFSLSIFISLWIYMNAYPINLSSPILALNKVLTGWMPNRFLLNLSIPP